MAKCVFVTATNTDSGKTHISGLILKAAKNKHLLTMGFKPLASGSHLYNEDAAWLRQLSTMQLTYEQVNPWCFVDPIAPHIAAKKQGVRITHELLSAHLTELRALSFAHQCDLILTEGAGGWLLPVNEQQTLNHWVVSEDMSVIMVVAMELGCLNHALLTARAIESDGARLIGWIANQPDAEPMAEYAENLAYLKSHLQAPCLAEVGYSHTPAEETFTGQEADRILKAIGCI